MPPDAPFGRDTELSQLDRFLDLIPAGLTAALITGPAGIGKTTIWREGKRRAEALGFSILSARPSEAETTLSFAGLADLLQTVDQGAFEAIPSPQRQALAIALLRDTDGSPFEGGRMIPTAFLSLLQVLAQTRPVVLAVDDAQWLDEATGRAMSFALRRVERMPVGVMASVRTDGEGVITFASNLPPERRTEIRLNPLSAAALHAILKRQLNVVFPRPTLVRIVAASGGNPFFAVEIARELQRVGVPAPGAPLPVPGELRLLVRSRLARLPSHTRDALLLAASMSQPTTGLVDPHAIAPAEEAGIVTIGEGGRIRFSHPLLASAVYESAARTKRHALHRELASLVTDPEERARHLALASTGPDSAVASVLEEAARNASSRGASTAAVELARQAVELTEDARGPDAARRALAVARYLMNSGGDPAEARSVLESALAYATDQELRAQLLLKLGSVARNEGDLDRGYDHLVEALRLTHDRDLAARIHVDAAWLSEGDPARAIQHCEAAVALLEDRDSSTLYSTALLHRAYLRLVTGQGADDDDVERGRVMQEVDDLHDTSPVPVLWPAFKDDFALARRRHEDRLAWARLVGDEPTKVSMLCHLAELELWTGDWARASVYASEAEEVIERTGSNLFLATALYARGQVHAHMGRIAQAAECGEAILRLTTFASSGFREVRGHALMGFIALSQQDMARADRHLTIAAEILQRVGEREPVRFRFQADHAEAVIAVGDLDRAAALLARLESRAAVFPRPWILAMAARTRGLLLAARGDLAGSLAAMHDAAAHHERLNMPFERARTLLLHGQVLRRRNDRRGARAKLEEASSLFERLGAPLWAERASAQLARVPVRRAPAHLTPTEERIAQLAAAGLTNKEVADRAFVSAKTVEANLARVYGKLGLHSRAELGRVMAERAAAPKT